MINIPTIGYIGLGLMGKPMARNILKAGYKLIVYNRTRDKIIELLQEGAAEGFSPADIARRTDIVFTNLSDTPDVLEVVLGENGVIQGSHSGMIFIDNSTIKPAAATLIAEEFGKKSIECIDAPVSGGEIGAINGTLTVMAGGSENALKIVLPVLNVIAKKVTHVGESGAGQIAKAANQIMVGAQMVAMGELLIFAQKAGVDPRKVVEAISTGAAQCWTLDQKPSRLFAGNRKPGFKAGLQAKDLRIVSETNKEMHINLPLSELVSDLFDKMAEMGLNNEDNSSIISVIEELNNIRLIEG